MCPQYYTLSSEQKARIAQYSATLHRGLPFEVSGLSWIGRGMSYEKEVSFSGSIFVSGDEMRLSDGDGSVLARCHPSQVLAQHVFGYFGMGLKLTMGDQGRWFVLPIYLGVDYSIFFIVAAIRRMRIARQVNRVFRAALREAGAQLKLKPKCQL